jgi:hypothetical protein
MANDLQTSIGSVRAALAKHALTFPDDISVWRRRFDDMRADLERLEFAEKIETAANPSAAYIDTGFY